MVSIQKAHELLNTLGASFVSTRREELHVPRNARGNLLPRVKLMAAGQSRAQPPHACSSGLDQDWRVFKTLSNKLWICSNYTVHIYIPQILLLLYCFIILLYFNLLKDYNWYLHTHTFSSISKLQERQSANCCRVGLLAHLFFNCRLRSGMQKRFLDPVLNRKHQLPESGMQKYLLSTTEPNLLGQVGAVLPYMVNSSCSQRGLGEQSSILKVYG